MNEKDRHTIKISTAALDNLRLLAAFTGEKQTTLLTAMIAQALEQEEARRATRHVLQQTQKGPYNR